MITKKLKYPKNPRTLLDRDDVKEYLFYLEENRALAKIEPSFLTYYIFADRLLNEVKNGGFQQYLTSSSVVALPYLHHCATLVGNDELCSIVDDLINEVDQRFNIFDILARKKVEFSDEFISFLSDLDTRFYALDNCCDIEKTVRIYYQAHIPTNKMEIQTAELPEIDNYINIVPKDDSTKPIEEIVSSYKCYNYNNKAYLVDMVLNLDSDKINWLEMNVPEEGVPPINWQAPYLEQYLTLDGNAKLCKLYGEPSSTAKPCRVVFFIFKCGGKILHTSYGDFPLTDTEDTPKQLKQIVEFENVD